MANRVRTRAQELDQFFAYVHRCFEEVNRQVQQSQDQDSIDSCQFRIESAYVNMCRVEAEVPDEQMEKYRNLLQKMETFQEILTTLQSDIQSAESQGPLQAPKLTTGKIGRPRYEISRDHLHYLLGLNFTVTKIAYILGVNPSTIHDRLRKYGMSARNTYCHLSDEELDAKVTAVVAHNKNMGYRRVRSFLDADGVKVPYHRVRQSLLRVDGASVAIRFGNTVKRRVYNVKSANTLWHLDGNHKLIRWKFVVHGCIDGYSRLIVFLKVATNNKAATVLKSFEEAVENYGLPSRIRSDQGVENRRVIEYMVAKRGAAHHPAIVGRSVHNQRIERLWVDVFQGCLCTYYELFRRMEEVGALNPLNDIQMFAFHFTFLPIIQRSLDKFALSYNRHPLSSQSGQTPEQLFFLSMVEHARSENPPTGVTDFVNRVNDSQDQLDTVGVDPDGPIPEMAMLNSEVMLDDIRCPLSEDVAVELKSSINPVEMCNDEIALDVYRHVLEFLQEKGIH